MTSAPLELGRAGFGAAPIGNLYREISDEQADATLQAAWDSGIRYFDTAPHYGLGLSEKRLGQFLRDRPRGEYVVSTKVGRLLEPNPAYAGGRDIAHGFDVPDLLVRRFDPSADGIRRSLEQSLTRMGLDRIDILYLHDPDAYDLERGLREGLPALERLRADGLVTEIGIGVNDAAVAARAVQEADLDLVMIAGRYTLLDHAATEQLFPACRARGTRVVAAAPFNSGLLATPRPRADATFDYAKVAPEVLARAEALAELCERHGVELPTAALQFPLLDKIVATVVVGTARPDAVYQNAQRMSAPIPDALWAELAETGWITAAGPAGKQDAT